MSSNICELMHKASCFGQLTWNRLLPTSIFKPFLSISSFLQGAVYTLGGQNTGDIYSVSYEFSLSGIIFPFIYVICMCLLIWIWYPQKSEEGTGNPGSGVAVSCKRPHRCEESKAGPPPEQSGLLPLESSFQLQSENLNTRSQETDSKEKLRNKWSSPRGHSEGKKGHAGHETTVSTRWSMICTDLSRKKHTTCALNVKGARYMFSQNLWPRLQIFMLISYTLRLYNRNL